MLRSILISLFVMAFGALSAQAQGWDPRTGTELSAKSAEKVAQSEATRQELLENDASLQIFFDEAYGYAVFPRVRKVGFLVGGGRSDGILFKSGEPYKKAYMTQYTAGLLAGVRTYSQIIFFKDRDAFDRFDYGEQASNTNVRIRSKDKAGKGGLRDYEDDVAIFVIDKRGALLDVSIGGQNFGTRELN